MQIPKTLFIIDDDYDDREMFLEAIMLYNPAINCLEFSNGIDALEILKSCQPIPDIIFLDLNMSRMSGKQCLQQIKSIPDFSKIPVVIYTTSSQVEDKEEMETLGAAYFLTKPNTGEGLKLKLGEVITALSETTKTV